jgi:hypothetical protein
VRALIVSSPGYGVTPHWSHAFAGQLAQALRADGAEVRWLAFVGTGQGQALPHPRGVDCTVLERDVPPLHRVGPGFEHTGVELAVTQALRATFTDAMVQVGSGARTSVHLCWIADRLGTRPFAVVRAAEVVCQRGDLVHRSGEPCREFQDAERCRECCALSRWRRPHAVSFSNRWDLLASGLATASVFVASDGEREMLEIAGVPARAVEVAPPDALVAAAARAVLAARAAPR